MKSEKVREFIDGCMEHLNIVITNENDQPLLKAGMSDHAKQQLRTAMTHAAELAEQEMKEELARWNDPEKVLPQKMKEVLLKISFEYDATIYRVGWLLDNGGFTMQSLVHGYCEIVGWRDIHE